MAFLVCYSSNPPEDHTRDRAIYLDQAFYEMIFGRCRGEESGFDILRAIAGLRYKSPILVVDDESLEVLVCELNRLSDLGQLHSQVPEFRNVAHSALRRKCSLTISGDMFPELQAVKHHWKPQVDLTVVCQYNLNGSSVGSS